MGLVEAPYQVEDMEYQAKGAATPATGADFLQAHAAALNFGLSDMGSSEDDCPHVQSVVPLSCLFSTSFYPSQSVQRYLGQGYLRLYCSRTHDFSGSSWQRSRWSVLHGLVRFAGLESRPEPAAIPQEQCSVLELQ